jgi:hypothetical protein
VQNQVEMRKKWMQNHTNFILILGRKKITVVWDCSQACCVLHTLYELEPSRMFLRFVAWAKTKIWKWSYTMLPKIEKNASIVQEI